MYNQITFNAVRDFGYGLKLGYHVWILAWKSYLLSSMDK